MPKLKEIPLRCLGSVKGSQFGVLLLLRQIRCWALLEKSRRRRRRKRALRGPLKIRIPKMKVRCRFYLRKLLTPMEVQVLTGVKAFQNLWSQLCWHSKKEPRVPFNSNYHQKSHKNILFSSAHPHKVIHSYTLNIQINLTMIK